jgi:hypothetical protein
VSGSNHSNTPPERMVELDAGALWFLHNDAPDSIRSFPYGIDRRRRCAYDEGASTFACIGDSHRAVRGEPPPCSLRDVLGG